MFVYNIINKLKLKLKKNLFIFYSIKYDKMLLNNDVLNLILNYLQIKYWKKIISDNNISIKWKKIVIKKPKYHIRIKPDDNPISFISSVLQKNIKVPICESKYISLIQKLPKFVHVWLIDESNIFNLSKIKYSKKSN